MLKLLAYRRVVRDVARNIGRVLKSDCTWHFHKFYFTVKVTTEQLSEYYVVIIWKNEHMSFRLCTHAAPKY